MGELLTQPQFELTPPEPKQEDKWERMIQAFIDKGADADKLAVMLDAIMRARKEDARLQFEAAFGRFRNHVPQVLKTKEVVIPNRDGSKTTYWHAELDKAFNIVDEEMRKEGLIASWRPSEGANGRTVVTCVFRHPESGHVEDMATLGGPPDSSGSKTPGQQIGSIAFYLERYTLFAAAGVVPKGMDNDAAVREGMSEDAITDYSIQMQDASNHDELKTIFRECFTKATGDKEAKSRLTKVYETKKREMLNAKH